MIAGDTFSSSIFMDGIGTENDEFLMEDLRFGDFEELQDLLVDEEGRTDLDHTESMQHDSDSLSSNSTSSEDNPPLQVQVKTRRKHRNNYRGPYAFPHLFKKDIRRDYAFMWMNVINMNDAKAFKSLLAYTSIKNCSHKNEFRSGLKDTFPLAAELSSRDRVILQCAYKSVTCPDTICQMQSCAIRRSTEFKGTEIILNVRYSGTLLYDLALPKGCTADDSSIGFLPSIDTKVLSKYRVPAATPAVGTMEGTFIITLDPNHFVSSVLFINTAFNVVPIKLPPPL